MANYLKMHHVYVSHRLALANDVANVLKCIGVTVNICDKYQLATIQSVWDSLEFKFVSDKRMMGAFINGVYEGSIMCKCPCISQKAMNIKLKWSGNFRKSIPKFINKSPFCAVGNELISSFNDDSKLINLLITSGVKGINISCESNGNEKHIKIVLYPIAGVISVIYFPPVPPFTAKMVNEEIKSHYQILNKFGCLLKKMKVRLN